MTLFVTRFTLLKLDTFENDRIGFPRKNEGKQEEKNWTELVSMGIIYIFSCS